MDHTPDPTLSKFNKDNITNIQQLETTYNELTTLPSDEFWNEHAYHKAVDQDPSSCWSTYQSKYSIGFSFLL